jgi:co-chaperonin GroES (HSP10)
MNKGGDVLARGAASAQFSTAANMTDFEADFIYKEVSEVMEKYDLTQAEYDTYAAQRDNNEKLPDLRSVSEEQEIEVGFSIKDHRSNYLSEPTEAAMPVKASVKKFPEPEYEPLQTLMDRILVMVISDDPDVELLEDGSTRNLKTGLISTAKYRQHSNVGIVLLAGQWVISGGVQINMSYIVKPGDKVIYGDYGSEKLPMKEDKAEALCASLGVNYEKTEQGLRVVRVQDIRTIERRKQEPMTMDEFIDQVPPMPEEMKS